MLLNRDALHKLCVYIVLPTLWGELRVGRFMFLLLCVGQSGRRRQGRLPPPPPPMTVWPPHHCPLTSGVEIAAHERGGSGVKRRVRRERKHFSTSGRRSGLSISVRHPSHPAGMLLRTNNRMAPPLEKHTVDGRMRGIHVDRAWLYSRI